jgi:uncharacterized membrane protein YdjX (TVP38/TMEM64 family)
VWVRLALLIALFGTLVAFHASGVLASIEAGSIQSWVRRAGAWGGVAFVATYAVLQPLGIRSLFFLLSAPLIWSPSSAILLSWIGAVVASVTAFGFARFVARDWAQGLAPARLRQIDERLAENGFRTVTLLRLVFYTTPSLQFALGVSRVRFAPFLFGTMVGVLPFTLLMTLLGAQMSSFFWGLLS